MPLVLFNPSAGSARKRRLTADELAAKLRTKGVAAEFLSPEPGEEELREALRREGQIIVAGGDGTIQSVLQVAKECRSIRLGIIPVGTANHLAIALGVPRDVDEAIEVIAAGRIRSIDVASANGAIFTQAAGVGFHAAIFQAYGERRRKSVAAATRATLSALANWTPRTVCVSLDGAQFEEKVTQVTAANTPRYGDHFLIAPEAKLDDGLLDVVVIGAMTRPQIVEYAAAALRGAHLSLPQTLITRARRVEVTAEGEEQLPVHADGFPVGLTPATFEVRPGCLEVMVPR